MLFFKFSRESGFPASRCYRFRNHTRRRTRLYLEPLEDRTVPSHLIVSGSGMVTGSYINTHTTTGSLSIVAGESNADYLAGGEDHTGGIDAALALLVQAGLGNGLGVVPK
jgi:hypothetical protein